MSIPTEVLYSALSTLVSFLVTIVILSYVIGDNPFFQVVLHIFIGVSVGYVLVVAWNQVIWPELLHPVVAGIALQDLRAVWLLLPLVGSLLLLMRAVPRVAILGQLPMAYLVGVGSAVIVGGAVLGTLLPQIDATIGAFDLRSARLHPFLTLFSSVLILVGVLGTLAYFHFGARQLEDGTIRRNALVGALTWIGRVYIAVSLGVIFAGLVLTALTAFISRVASFRELFDALDAIGKHF